MSETRQQPDGNTDSQEGLPCISIVIIGRNEGQRLVRCLTSISEVAYPHERIEMIYVDTDSTDDSCAQAERLGAKVLPINPERPTAALARNAGLEVARYEYIQFLDGDTILDHDWLAKAVKTMSDPEVACVFGRREEISPNATIYNFWTHHDWYAAQGPADSCGGDALFRRSVLRRVRGYDDTLIAGEEPDLCARIRYELGMTILSLGERMTRHDMNMTRFSQYWRRCKRTGHAYAEVSRRHSNMQRWRMARWRNLVHCLALPAAIGFSVGIPSIWPVIIWGGLMTLAVSRNALRLRRRVDTWRGALLYSLHFYLCKPPMLLGQCSYWLRSLFRRNPQQLMEYRQ